MEAFFESPKSGNNATSSISTVDQQQQQQQHVNEQQQQIQQQEQSINENNVVLTTTTTTSINQNESNTELHYLTNTNTKLEPTLPSLNDTTNSVNLLNENDQQQQLQLQQLQQQQQQQLTSTHSNLNENHQHQQINQHEHQSNATHLTELTDDLHHHLIHQQQQQQQQQQQHHHHVKLDIENGQVVMVDPIETVVLVTTSGTSQTGSNELTLVQAQTGTTVSNDETSGVTVSLSDTTGMLEATVTGANCTGNSMVDSSLIVASSALGLDADDSTQMDDDPNDTSIKDIDEALMSPGFNSLGINSSYVLNGNNVSTHTFRKTEWDVKKLENYVRLSFGDSTPMESMQPALMNRYLVSFFKLAKKSDGMDYEPESLIGFMNSFERYLKTKNYPESLLRSETFKESRTELKKKRDLVRSIGKLIRTKTKDTCYLLQFHRNLLKEKGLLNRDNPDCLLAEIYLNNMIYFGEFLKEDKAWRGNLNLVWGDMLLERDPQTGVEYLTLATYAKKSSRGQQHQSGVVKVNSRTKTGTQTSKLRAAAAAAAAAAANQSGNPSLIGNLDANSPRVYARQPANYCPVEAFKIYRSRRPNNCLDRDSPFYLAPLFKSKNQSKVWYKALAMSCQRLDALFYCLFKKAGVDLASLASMSQQQQQQAVAAAASIINNNNNNNNQTGGSGAGGGVGGGSNVNVNGDNNQQLIGINHMNISSDTIVGVNVGSSGSNNNTVNNSSLNNSSLTQWKAVMKDGTSQITDDVNELLLNGNVKHVVEVQNANNTTYHHAGGTTFYTTTTNANGAQTTHGHHHIVTTVPAQVQVQVQVQVQLPQHQQQQQQQSTVNANHHHVSNALNATTNNAAATLLV